MFKPNQLKREQLSAALKPSQMKKLSPKQKINTDIQKIHQNIQTRIS